MDIEKLKSIIRLANNNPNENEANLAARKACKTLAENDFAIFKPKPFQPSKAQEDFVNRARSRPAPPPYSPTGRRTAGPFGRGFETPDSDFWERFWKDAEKSKVYNTPDSEQRTYDWETKSEPNFRGGNPGGGKSQRVPIKCAKCGWYMDFIEPQRAYRCNNNFCGYTITEREYRDSNKGPSVPPNWEPQKKQSIKKKCTKCGLEVETFRFKEEPFVCSVCHWKDL